MGGHRRLPSGALSFFIFTQVCLINVEQVSSFVAPQKIPFVHNKLHVGQNLKDLGDEKWSSIEDWLIFDNYKSYVIEPAKVVLWRRMVFDIPELAAKTPEEVRTRWLELRSLLSKKRNGSSNSDSAQELESENAPTIDIKTLKSVAEDIGTEISPELLNDDGSYRSPPLLEDWVDLGDGIFEGRIYGQHGLLDGISIKTSAVDYSGRHFRERYVETQSGAIYELGESRERPGMVNKILALSTPTKVGTAMAVAGTAVVLSTALSHHLSFNVFVV